MKTPLGDYNPDWAIVKEDSGRVYLVRETKSTRDLDELRRDEKLKILCGKAHFKGCLGQDFAVVTKAGEV